MLFKKIMAGYSAKIITFLFVLSSVACSSSSSGSGNLPVTGISATQENFVKNYAAIVLATFEDSLEGAQTLKGAIETFIANPTLANFNAAKTAWLASREPYGQTEMTRFFDSPIDGDDGLPEYLMNAWPLDEAYIDYVTGLPSSGLVNDTTFDLTKENLITSNGASAEDAVSTGYHAIEFLLWGQDKSDTTGGVRPYTDYLTVGGTALNQERRKIYLGLLGEILVEHLAGVTSQWETGAANYRNELVNTVSVEEAIRRIIVGVGSLAGAELGGERMAVAMVTGSQEDEHSCFSDNTHRDLVTDLQGIVNVYNGRYTRTDGTTVGDGTGLSDLIAAVNSELNSTLQANLNAAITAINQISTRASNDNVSFDQQISLDDENSADRQNIQDAIDALQAFADNLSLAAADLGIDINLE